MATSNPPSDPKLKVLVFSGSLRADSLNGQLASQAAKIAADLGAQVDLASMHDFDVPAYDGDEEMGQGIPAGAQELQRRLLANDAFIVALPEYNGSMPGVLKNLIDWTSCFRPQPFDGFVLPFIRPVSWRLWASSPSGLSLQNPG